MSIRLGTSTVLLRRAKLRRVRRASTAAKKRLLRRARDGQRSAPKSATSKDSTDYRRPEGQPTLTDPTLDDPRMWRGAMLSGWLRLLVSTGDFTGKSANVSAT